MQMMYLQSSSQLVYIVVHDYSKCVHCMTLVLLAYSMPRPSSSTSILAMCNLPCATAVPETLL